MEKIRSKLRRWGNSLGVIIPQKIVEKGGAKEGDEINILISINKLDLKELFGSLKNWKIDSQRFKDEVRRNEK